MLTNPNNLWYTDIMTIYRVEPYRDGNLSKNRRVEKYSSVPCRVYKSGHGATTMKTTASEVSKSDMLACSTEVDLQEGDEVVVIRGGKLSGGTGPTTTYFIGEMQDYYEPFGGVIPGLRHKQAQLGGDRKIKKTAQSPVVD